MFELANVSLIAEPGCTVYTSSLYIKHLLLNACVSLQRHYGRGGSGFGKRFGKHVGHAGEEEY